MVKRKDAVSLAARATAGLAGVLFVAVSLPALPASAATAVLSLSSTSGPVGTSVTVTGAGFPGRSAGSMSFGSIPEGSFTTSKTGGFSSSFTVPQTSSGSVTVEATAGSGTASSNFSVVAPAIAPPPTSAPSFVKASGRQLTLDGAPYRFTGINAPDLSTDYNVNYGCGETNSPADVTDLMSSLAPASMVRVWAFQQIAWDKSTNKADFAVLDRVVNTAAQTGQKLVLVLSHQWGGGCGESYKTEGWYATGYRQALNDGTALGAQTTPLSYWDWVRTIVARYAASPAVAMWEPVNEPNPTISPSGGCSTTAAATLRQFFDAVGGLIHSLDANHLVSSGLQGSGQCGTAGVEYQTLHQSPGLDVATVHDYYSPTVAMPGDQWNGVQVRINQMTQDDKPIFVEEVGINASDTTAGLPTLAQRRDEIKAKMDAQIPAGMVGYTPWTWSHTVSASNYNISTGDPTLTLLHGYVL